MEVQEEEAALGLKTKRVRFEWGWNEYVENQIRQMVTTWQKEEEERKQNEKTLDITIKTKQTNTVTSSVIVY